VNLRRARKAKARVEAAEVAAVNRSRFGRTRAECEASEKATRLEQRRLEGHKREPISGRSIPENSGEHSD